MSEKRDPERVVREIKRKTRRKFSAEEKIRIVLQGLRGEESIAERLPAQGRTDGCASPQGNATKFGKLDA